MSHLSDRITTTAEQPPRAREAALHEVTRPPSSDLARLVSDRLRSAIIRQELTPGARLNQVRLAERLGVSRMPVRAAIAELTTEGLIESLPTGGARVRELTTQDLLHVYEVRTGLETQAVRHLAEDRAGSRLELLSDTVERHRPLVTRYDTAQLLDLDREFHTTVLEATGNPFFVKAMRPVWAIVERAMFGMLSLSHVAATAWDEHVAIHEAIQAAEADRAVGLMRTHLHHGACELVARLPEG